MSTLLHDLVNLARRSFRGRRGAAIVAFGVIGVLSGAVLVTGGFICLRAAPFLFAVTADVPPRRVAIVPGCRVFPDGTPSRTLEDRLATALEAYRGGRVSKILVSGQDAEEGSEVEAMRRWLEAAGVPRDDLLVDPLGLRTIDTMARARSVFGVSSAIVCTQRFHLARSVFLARRFGIDAVGLAADRRVYEKARSDALREAFARSAAFFEVYVLRKGAGR